MFANFSDTILTHSFGDVNKMDDLAGFFILGGLFLVIVWFVVQSNKREFYFYTLPLLFLFNFLD